MTELPDLDLLVLGSGVAGLSAAVAAADAYGLRVGVLTKGELDQSTTRWAQGGVAAVLTEDPDSTDLHLADTLAAGAGLCDLGGAGARRRGPEPGARAHRPRRRVRPRRRRRTARSAREGGHTPRPGRPRRRRGHGRRDRAGARRGRRTRPRPACSSTGSPSTCSSRAAGAAASSRSTEDGAPARGAGAAHVLLATGGAGQLFAVTTNPVEATGDGVAMALRAGVAVADVEFMQFHPTALHHPADAAAAAVRGAAGPRRAAARRRRRALRRRAAAPRRRQPGDDGPDARAGRRPPVARRHRPRAASTSGSRPSPPRCAEVGLDPATDWLPIAPAAHYLCGGVVTDLDGATALPGLWAAGEVACSGVHGANRLASNSLLEGMVFAPRVVEAIERGRRRARRRPAPCGPCSGGRSGRSGSAVPSAATRPTDAEAHGRRADAGGAAADGRRARDRCSGR